MHNVAAEPGPWVFHIRVERYPGPHRTPQAAPNLSAPRPGCAIILQFQLLTTRQRRFHSLAHQPEAIGDTGLERFVPALGAQ